MDIKGYEKFGVLPLAKWDYEPVKAANELMVSGKAGEGTLVWKILEMI